MSIIQQVLRGYVNLKHDKLAELTKISLYNIYPACREADGDNDACTTIASIVLSAVYADGVVTDKEKLFLGEVLRIDEAAVDALLSCYTKDMPKIAKKFSNGLTGELKVEVARLVLCIGSADLTLAKEEAHFMLDMIE